MRRKSPLKTNIYNSVNIPKEIKYSSLYFANIHIKKKITKYFQNISTQKEKKGKNLIATVAMRCIHCYPRGCPNVNKTVNETVRARNKILTTNIL